MEDDQLKLFSKIKRGDWRFHKPDWKNISEDAKDLIRALLVTDPVERMTVDEALRSPWIKRYNDSLSSVDLGGSISNLMQKRQKLRSVAKSLIFMGKLRDAMGSSSKIVEGEDESESEVQDNDVAMEFDKQSAAFLKS